MVWITEAAALAHLRLDSVEEEPNLVLYISASCEAVEDYLDRSVYLTQEALDAAKADAEEAGDAFDEYAMVVTDVVRLGALLMLADIYRNREDTAKLPQLPTAARNLLAPKRARMGL